MRRWLGAAGIAFLLALGTLGLWAILGIVALYAVLCSAGACNPIIALGIFGFSGGDGGFVLIIAAQLAMITTPIVFLVALWRLSRPRRPSV